MIDIIVAGRHLRNSDENSGICFFHLAFVFELQDEILIF
jgi:hypothetical protein